MAGRDRTCHAETHVAVVEPAAIRQRARPVEDRRFGRHGGARDFHERVTRIAKGGHRVTKRLDVLANRLRRLGGVGIDQPERDAVRREPLVQTLHDGRVAIGDRAVHAGEQEDDRGGLCRLPEWIDGTVVEIDETNRGNDSPHT